MVVFSEPKVKILSHLIENRLDEFSIKNLADILKIDYKNCNLAVKSLEEEGVLKVKKMGRGMFCKFANKYTPIVGYVEFLRRESICSKKRNIKLVVRDLELIKKPFICLLFGSYAKNQETKSSDIDLLIIAEDEKEIERVIKRYPFDVHITVFSYSEFISMANNKEFSVVLEVLKRNIVLIGIEEFYRLMKNVK